MHVKHFYKLFSVFDFESLRSQLKAALNLTVELTQKMDPQYSSKAAAHMVRLQSTLDD